jgi:serine/threonine-protein kinase HipA
MTSDANVREAFVWMWLPGAVQPVVAGRLAADTRGHLLFNYGKSYLERIHDDCPAIALYEPELPLRRGLLPLPSGLSMPGCLRDAAPDAWGRRVILNKRLGSRGRATETAQLDELIYLLESGSDRIGALDFQRSPSEYIPRSPSNVPLAQLQESAERVERGIALSPELDQALFHGSSIGGARPKALIEDSGRKYIAKFSSSTDLYNVVKAEFLAMRLAALAGLQVAPVSLTTAASRDVLLIERFDREAGAKGWTRRAVVSALTLFGLDEMMARYASYETFAEIIRHRFEQPQATLRELFSRLAFNILCGNTDDHARNHAAFWNGHTLQLTPAYDICPQSRSGNEATQAMLISGNNRLSTLQSCREAAHHFLLSAAQASAIMAAQRECVERHWDAVCDEAAMSEIERRALWRRQFLNPIALGE